MSAPGPHPPAPDGASRRAELGLGLLVVIWAVNFSVIKVGLAEFEPFAFNALRFPLAALLLTTALVARGRLSRPDRGDVARILWLGVLGHFCYQFFFILGMDRTRAGNAALMMATVPVYTALLSAFAGHERVRPAAWAGMIATLAGVGLVIAGGPGEISFSSATVVGDLLIMGAAVVWALYTVGSRDLVRKYGSLAVTAWVMWVGTALLVVLGIPDLLAFDGAPPGAWAAVAFAGFFGIGLAYLLWYIGVRVLGNTHTAVYQNMVPIGAIAVAWLWLDEVPTALQLAGAAVVIGGVSLVRRAMRR